MTANDDLLTPETRERIRNGDPIYLYGRRYVACPPPGADELADQLTNAIRDDRDHLDGDDVRLALANLGLTLTLKEDR